MPERISSNNMPLTINELLKNEIFAHSQIMTEHYDPESQIVRFCHLENDDLEDYIFSGKEMVLTTGEGIRNQDAFLEYLNVLINNHLPGLIYIKADHSFTLTDKIRAYLNTHHFPLIVTDDKFPIVETIKEYNARLALNNEIILSDEYYQCLLKMDGRGKYPGFDLSNWNEQIRDYIRFTSLYLNIDTCYWHILSEPIYSREACRKIADFLNEDILKKIDAMSDLSMYDGGDYLLTKITFLKERYAYIICHTADRDSYILHILERLTAFLRTRITDVFASKLLQEHTIDNSWALDWFNGKLSEYAVKEHLRHYGIVAKPQAFYLVLCKSPSDPKTALKKEEGVNHTYKQMTNFAFKASILIHRTFLRYGFRTIEMMDDDYLKVVVIVPHDLHDYRKIFKEIIDEIIPQSPFFEEYPQSSYAISKEVNELTALPLAQSSALFVAEMGKREKVVLYDRLYIERVLEELHMANVLEDYVYDHLKALLDDEILLKTLECFYHCNCSKQKTAEKLFIARQTLYARLNKIAALIGDDYDRDDKRLALEVALAGKRFLAKYNDI